MRSEVLRRIQHHRSEARSGVGPIGRETDVRQEGLSIIPLSPGLHDGSEVLLECLMSGNVRQGR
jgi:hypothetical protein